MVLAEQPRANERLFFEMGHMDDKEPEVTPEMLEAGLAVLREYLEFDYVVTELDSELAKRTYLAMRSAGGSTSILPRS